MMKARMRFVAPLASLCTMIGVLALSSVPASAALVHPFVSSFGSFSNVQGVAVNSATGNVYVYDAGTKEILQYDASGTPVDFSATGTNAISGLPGGYAGENELAVDSSTGPAQGDIYLATGSETRNVLIFSEAGGKIGELYAAAGVPWGETCGVAVDKYGAVYVGIYSGDINKYVPTINPVTNADYTSSIKGAAEPCNLAVDSSGDVFADEFEGGIDRYEATDFGGAATHAGVSSGGTLAVDPTDDELYVDERGSVAQLGRRGQPFEQPVARFAESGPGGINNSDGVAVSGFNRDVYVSDGSGHISVFGPARAPETITLAASNPTTKSATLNGSVNPEGLEVSQCYFEYGTQETYGQTAPCAETVGSGTSPVAVHAEISGLEPSTNYHFRLVTGDAEGETWNGSDETFDSLGPIVSGVSVVEATSSSAVVSASINPNSAPTTFKVEYGETASYGSSTSEGAPLAAAAGEYAVHTTISGLSPGTTYHFRFVVTNEDSTARSTDGELHTHVGERTRTGCPNESLRYGYGANLPDCRAYEQATAVEKDGTNPESYNYDVEAASGGNAVTFYSEAGIPGSTGAQTTPTFLASRGADGWTTQGLLPPATAGDRAGIDGWTPDLSVALTYAFAEEGHKDTTLLLRNNSDGSLQTIIPYTSSSANQEDGIVGVSEGDREVFFEEAEGNALTPDAPAGEPGVYVWDSTTGAISLVGVLPDSACGAPPCVPAEGSTDHAARNNLPHLTQQDHFVSSDGQRAYFTDRGTGQVYLRENPTSPSATTVQVSASQKTNGTGAGGRDPNGPQPADLLMATPDGSQAFFTSHEALTNDANTGASDEGTDLYSYDAASGDLTDLTPDAGDLNGAEVQGVVGVSEDGSYVYFAANGDLDGSGPATRGDCSNPSVDETGPSGECNLYLWHDGSITFVAKLDAEGGKPVSDSADWRAVVEGITGHGDAFHTGWVSADGHVVIFRSTRKLTGYDNQGTPEFYRYDVDSGIINCVSCNPSGAPATAAPGIQANTALIGVQAQPAQTRNASASGDQFFFETTESLLSRDTNGTTDVYEWEADGAGSCESAAEDGGCMYLLSTGTSQDESHFADASNSGDDAFIFTSQPLVAQDRDQLVDIYDVRVDGGLASQDPPQSNPCSGEACKGPAASPFSTAPSGSATFTGAGNLTPAVPTSTKPTPKPLTRAQQLVKALKSCRKDKSKRKRSSCESQARKRFGPKQKAKATKRRAKAKSHKEGK
jgi:hypothetical protein